MTRGLLIAGLLLPTLGCRAKEQVEYSLRAGESPPPDEVIIEVPPIGPYTTLDAWGTPKPPWKPPVHRSGQTVLPGASFVCSGAIRVNDGGIAPDFVRVVVYREGMEGDLGNSLSIDTGSTQGAAGDSTTATYFVRAHAPQKVGNYAAYLISGDVKSVFGKVYFTVSAE